MNAPCTIAWPTFELDGVPYDLSHLNMRTYAWEIELKNKLCKQIEVEVIFSCHCFSRSPKEGEEYRQEQVVYDHKKVRLFDIRRYQLSLKLPEIISELPAHKVFQTGYHNLVRVVVADPLESSSEYHVFLALTRNGKKVKMVVESAYPADLLEDRKKFDKPIRFRVALRNRFEGR